MDLKSIGGDTIRVRVSLPVFWRDTQVVEGTGLENQQVVGISCVGSNPTLSVILHIVYKLM